MDDIAQLQHTDGRVNATIITTYLAHRVLSAIRKGSQISFVSPAFFLEIQRNNGVAIFADRAWPHGFDFFTQHFVCFAVGGSDHWSLAVLCHPRAARMSSSPLSSCILIFDSHIKGGLHDHQQIAAHLRAYLQLLSSASDNAFTADSMPLISLPVPQQKWGSVDCGVYMLHNLDQFIAASSEVLSLASTYLSHNADLKPQTSHRIQELFALPNVLVKRTSIVAVLRVAASVPRTRRSTSVAESPFVLDTAPAPPSDSAPVSAALPSPVVATTPFGSSQSPEMVPHRSTGEQALLRIATRARLTSTDALRRNENKSSLPRPNARQPFSDTEEFLWNQMQIAFTKDSNKKPDWGTIHRWWRVFGLHLNAAGGPGGIEHRSSSATTPRPDNKFNASFLNHSGFVHARIGEGKLRCLACSTASKFSLLLSGYC